MTGEDHEPASLLSQPLWRPLALGFAWPAAAQDFPSRAITLIVPYPPGGGVDAMARIVGDKLSAALGQQVIVDNRGGGGGNIGTRAVAKSAPDGYTLLLGHTGTISINPSLYANAGYDPRKDFAPIGLMASMPVALLAHPSFPGKTVADVIAIAKKAAGQAQHRHLGDRHRRLHVGRICSSRRAGLDVAIVPYKGTAPVMNDLLGGHVPIAFGVLPPALGNLSGRHAARDRGAEPRNVSACCPTCRPRRNPACRDSNPCCITDCSRPPARRGRSSSGSTRSCARWSRLRTCRPASTPKAATSSPPRPTNTPPTSTARRPSGATLIRKLNLKVE